MLLQQLRRKKRELGHWAVKEAGAVKCEHLLDVTVWKEEGKTHRALSEVAVCVAE